ncbi:MAG: TIGR02444 family protein [Pseudomonas sp.]
MHTTDLWSFALACYARPRVERLCLELQEQGVDICLLLCGAWLEARAISCTPQRLERLRQLAGHWQHEVVTPLRSLRQNWRDAAQSDLQMKALREQLKALELAAEKTLLGRLERETQYWPTQSGPAPWLEPLTGCVRDGDAAREFLRRTAAAAQLELAGA